MQREMGTETASQPRRFTTGWAKREDLPGFSPLPGVRMEVYSGGRMMLNFYTIQPDATIGWHSHPHEQCGTVLEGEIHLRVGSQDAAPWVLRAGDVYVIAPDTPHTGTAGPDGVVALDIFAPPREDYLAHAQARRGGSEGTYLSGTPPLRIGGGTGVWRNRSVTDGIAPPPPERPHRRCPAVIPPRRSA